MTPLYRLLCIRWLLLAISCNLDLLMCYVPADFRRPLVYMLYVLSVNQLFHEILARR